MRTPSLAVTVYEAKPVRPPGSRCTLTRTTEPRGTVLQVRCSVRDLLARRGQAEDASDLSVRGGGAASVWMGGEVETMTWLAGWEEGRDGRPCQNRSL